MKSYVSDLLEVALTLLRECESKSVAAPSLVDIQRDAECLRRRVEHEGLSFLTITLPQYCQDFESSLESGCVDPKSFRSFQKDGRIPAFGRGIVGQLFDRETGLFKHGVDPHVQADIVRTIRQISRSFAKVSLECTSARTRRALVSFARTEQELQSLSVQDELLAQFRTVSTVLWPPVVSVLQPDDLVPRHGPGVTAEGTSGNQKYHWQYWSDALDRLVPLYAHGYPMGAVGERGMDSWQMPTQDEMIPARVIPVPKTLKTPRIIAAEPAAHQYVQQALRDQLYAAIGADKITGGRINFTDQEVNQQLALRGSADASNCTIDLSDASDRVLNDLAGVMFESSPLVWETIQACRSTRAELPWGEKVPLVKFASMGNALTFPVESMYFYTICVVALHRLDQRPVSRASVREYGRQVYVYGDDIVVPQRAATTVIATLHEFHCRVNVRKTFWKSHFRESCGMDSYFGYRVTPTYIRRKVPMTRQDVSEIVSTCSTARQLHAAGLVDTAELLFTKLEQLLGPMPNVGDDSPALGRPQVDYLADRSTWRRFRVSTELHRIQIYAWVVEPVYRTDPLDGWPALTKCLLNMIRGNPPIHDKKHLDRSVQRGAVALKLRWVNPQ